METYKKIKNLVEQGVKISNTLFMLNLKSNNYERLTPKQKTTLLDLEAKNCIRTFNVDADYLYEVFDSITGYYLERNPYSGKGKAHLQSTSIAEVDFEHYFTL